MSNITSQAVNEISTSWHKSVENILKTANLICKYFHTDEWKAESTRM